MAALAAVFGTAIVFAGAYLIEKGQGLRSGRALAQLLAMLPMAVPGLVLGLGYVFFINAKWNPLGVLYGTIAAAGHQLDRAFLHDGARHGRHRAEADRQRVRGGLGLAQGAVLRTFARVTVPICMPAILDIAVYMFVNAMTTVSAVIFLYGASTKLASISIVHMDEAGATAAAAAMATLIVLTALAVKLLHLVARPPGLRQAAGLAQAVMMFPLPALAGRGLG